MASHAAHIPSTPLHGGACEDAASIFHRVPFFWPGAHFRRHFSGGEVWMLDARQKIKYCCLAIEHRRRDVVSVANMGCE